MNLTDQQTKLLTKLATDQTEHTFELRLTTMKAVKLVGSLKLAQYTLHATAKQPSRTTHEIQGMTHTIEICTEGVRQLLERILEVSPEYNELVSSSEIYLKDTVSA